MLTVCGTSHQIVTNSLHTTYTQHVRIHKLCTFIIHPRMHICQISTLTTALGPTIYYMYPPKYMMYLYKLKIY